MAVGQRGAVRLTGPIGTRRNRTVALVTDDLRLYHRLVPVFDRQGLPLLGLRPDEDVPDSVQALLDGPADDPRSVPVRSDVEATVLAVLQRLDGRPTAQGGYDHVVFGVDPGRTIGLAVVADGAPLLVAEALDPEAAAHRIAAWRSGLEAHGWSVHLGDGSPEWGVPIAAAVHTATGLECLLVPETSTSPASPATGSRHADAAIRIALRRP